MSSINRRDFIRVTGLGAATAATGLPSLVRKADAATSANVVILGGGFSGATAAKYLVEWASAEGMSLNVTLIDRNATYASPILSNLVLVGKLPESSLNFSYASLAGVNFVQAEVSDIDTVLNQVTAGGNTYAYDRLIVAPGIDFLDTNANGDPIIGLRDAIDNRSIIPAWKGGADVTALKQQLAGVPAGNGVFILSIPKAPYRCPPGPYERACVVADWLNQNRPGARVIVLDANLDITAEKHTFSTAFSAMGVDYRSNVHLSSVSYANNQWTVFDSMRRSYFADVLNVLPRQRAGLLLDKIRGIIPIGNLFADVHALTYESIRFPGVHVIGDAQATPHPKAGHVGNGEAKVCADAILKMIRTNSPDTAQYIANVGENTLPAVVTNSACYSPIKASTGNTASYLTVGFRADQNNGWVPTKIDASLGEAPSPTGDNWKDMFDWAENLFYDTFNVTRNVG